MKIKDLLKRLEETKILDMAKEIGIGRDRLRNFLKEIGCEPNKGKSGWTYKGDNPAILEEDLFTHMKPSNSKSTPKDNKNNTSKNNSTPDIINNVKRISKEENTINAEIQAIIEGKKSSKPTKIYKGIYFDGDIAKFLDNIQHGNKSELVNKIMRAYLVENGLL